jgi:hypothetical protein
MRSLLLLSLNAVLALPSFSQQVELQFSSGFGFESGGSPLSSYDRMDYYSPDNTITTTVKNAQDKYYSFGQGLRFECRMIVFIKDEVGLFIQPAYSSGSQSSNITNSSFLGGVTGTQSSGTSISFSSPSIQVGIHFQKHQGFFQPFAGLGAGYFFPSNPVVTQQETNGYADNYTYTETQVTTNTPLGYLAYLGANIPLRSDISFFVEAKATLVNFYIKREEITEYLVNSINQLGSLTTNQKITIYEKNKNYISTSPEDVNSPTYGGPPQPASGSTLSITAGFSFNL